MTRRSDTALRCRATTAAASSSTANALARAIRPRSPTPSSVIGSEHNRRSTMPRSAADRHAVSRTNSVARHSFNRPDRSRARVCGISCTSACANPRCRPPRFGDSLRANAICDPTPRAHSDRGSLRALRSSRILVATSSVITACTAHPTDFNVSIASSRSMPNPASPLVVSAHCRRAVNARNSSRSTAPTTNLPQGCSNICSILATALASGNSPRRRFRKARVCVLGWGRMKGPSTDGHNAASKTVATRDTPLSRPPRASPVAAMQALWTSE